MTNRTKESLLERRALAEKAIDGPWEVLHSNSEIVMPKNCGPELCAVASCFGSRADAAHIAANSPEVVMADIDEILHLRAENERLEKEANWLAAEALERRVICTGCPHNRKCVSFEDCARHWRVAARKAVEEIELMEENQ